MMRDVVERRPSDAWNLALKLSGLSFGLVGAYVVAVTLGQDLVFLVFGESFRAYQSLIIPVALGQVVLSASAGFTILLIAARRMREIAFVVLFQSSLTLVLVLSLALATGLEGAAWVFAVAEVPSLAVLIAFARRVQHTEAAALHAHADRVPPWLGDAERGDRAMRILALHSRYLSGTLSGENRVVDDELQILRKAGDDVLAWQPSVGPDASSLHLATAAVWSRTAAREVQTIVREHRPEIVHVHNLFPRLSPVVLRAVPSRARPPSCHFTTSG